jgi:Cu/Ag efflux protein CusF
MRWVFIAAVCLLIPAVALAQSGGGGGGGHGGRGGRSQGQSKPTATSPAASAPPETPLSDIEIVGVVTQIDPVAARLTIAYEPVDALDWPAGSKPFEVSRTDLLKGVTVGQKIRFKLDSQQISDLRPY